MSSSVRKRTKRVRLVQRAQFIREWRARRSTEMTFWTLWSMHDHQRWINPEEAPNTRESLTSTCLASENLTNDIIVAGRWCHQHNTETRSYVWPDARNLCWGKAARCSYINNFISVYISHSCLNTCFTSLQYFKVPNANCTTDSDCVQGVVNFDGHGSVFFFIKSCLRLHTAYVPMVYSCTVQNLRLNLVLQVEGRANAFSTTITLSKPVRFKLGVLWRSTLQYGKWDKNILYQFLIKFVSSSFYLKSSVQR